MTWRPKIQQGFVLHPLAGLGVSFSHGPSQARSTQTVRNWDLSALQKPPNLAPESFRPIPLARHGTNAEEFHIQMFSA